MFYHDFRHELPDHPARQRLVLTLQRRADVRDPLFQHPVADQRQILRPDLQRFQQADLVDERFFLTFAGVITRLQVLGVAHFLDRIHDVLKRRLDFLKLRFQRVKPDAGVARAFVQLLRDLAGNRAQILDRHDVLQQIVDHRFVETPDAHTLGVTALTARVLRRHADEERVRAALAFLRGDMLDVHGVFFAVDVAAHDESRQQVVAAHAARFLPRIHLLALVLLVALGAVNLFVVEPLFGDHGGDEVFVQHVAEAQRAGIDRVAEERIIRRRVAEQLGRRVDFAVTRALTAHLPRQQAAIPHLRIRHDALDDTRFTRVASFLALEYADLDALGLESARDCAGHHAEIAAGTRPIRIVLEELGIVVARGDQLGESALGVLRDLVQRLLVLPLLEGFDQRVNRRVAGVGRRHQIDQRDSAQAQVGLDVRGFDAVTPETVRLPEDHAERTLGGDLLAFVAVVDRAEALAQVEEHLL
ncbi:MAG TPA: hypothetical protein PKX07_17065 [Aggregatilineales bacterium]|nr:hypothetical protein [Aggregatilineales bacterium]